MNEKLSSALRNGSAMAATIVAAVTLGWQAPSMFDNWNGHVRAGDFREHLAGQPQRLTLYGTSTCPACMKAREFMGAAGILYNDQNIESSARAKLMYARTGEKRVPVLVSDTQIAIGFQPDLYATMAK